MKRKSMISKIEKYFNFLKMDKKNVQKKKAQIFYEKCVSCDDKKFLTSHHKKNNFHFVTINFLYFFIKVFRDFYVTIIYSDK